MTVEMNEREEGGILIISLIGRLDAASSPLVERKIHAHIDKGQNSVILDCTDLDYLSSAGMRLLLAVTKKLKGQRGKLVLAAVGGEAMDVIKMAGFDHLLEIYPDADHAKRGFMND